MNQETIAAELIDALVAAHFAFKDESGWDVARVVLPMVTPYEGDAPGRNLNALCSYVNHYSYRGSLEVYAKTPVSIFLERVLKTMYGSGGDPFGHFVGGSYFEERLNFEIRSREALVIAKYIEDNYL